MVPITYDILTIYKKLKENFANNVRNASPIISVSFFIGFLTVLL